MTRRLCDVLERDAYLETALSPSGEIALTPLGRRGSAGRGFAAQHDITDQRGLPPVDAEAPDEDALLHVLLSRDLEPEPELRRRRCDAARRPFAAWREDLVTGLFALSLALGLFSEGWKALARVSGANGVLLNAWHGLLLTGFTGLAFWSLTRHQGPKRSLLTRVPKGYALAVLGLVAGFAALAGEAMWQTAFRAPANPATNVSPFHLILLVASFLLAGAALRSMWLKPEGRRVPTIRAFAPVLLSAIAVTSVALFAAQFQSPLVAWTRPDPAAAGLQRLLQINATAAIVLTNLILIAPVLFILRRWQPPLGGVTVMLTSVALMASAVTGFERVGGVLRRADRRSGSRPGDLLVLVRINGFGASPDRAGRHAGVLDPLVRGHRRVRGQRVAGGAVGSGRGGGDVVHVRACAPHDERTARGRPGTGPTPRHF
ncbi:MAG: hypothetical protein GEU81_18050 [Nitriliruptorales bacterium]|nr:hypothetical protein [Nitriliruptorales bacterium]